MSVPSLGRTRVGTMMGAWPGAVALAVVASPGKTPGSECGGEPKAAVDGLTNDGQLMVPSSEGGVKVDKRWSSWELVALGLAGARMGDASCGKERAKGGLSAWRGSSGLDSGPAPSDEKEWVGCNG